MRVNTFAESVDDLPPPPYTPVDPVGAGGAAPVVPHASAQRSQTSLRGGYIRPSLPSEVPSEDANFPSAANYFDERQPSLPNGLSLANLIVHHITFFPDTTRDDIFFPHPIETYIGRDLTNLDWSTFVNCLFPVLDRSANEKVGNEKGVHPRAFMEGNTPERRQRIRDVVAQWNEGFFSPRLIHINVEFAPNPSRSVRASTASNTDTPIPFNENGYSRTALYHHHRSQSYSSSSSSSSSSSVYSIKSRDLEGADINSLRSAFRAFRLDPTKKDHLRQSVRQLCDEFRSQRRHHHDHHERKELKKEYKDQRKEVKKEVKAVVKEIKAVRKADRKLRKAERKSWRRGKRAESRGMDRISHAQRQLERAEEKTFRSQARGMGDQERAADHRARHVHGEAGAVPQAEETARCHHRHSHGRGWRQGSR